MSTEFVSPLDHSEDILGKKGKNAPTSQNIEMDLNRPRRKDTPALHKPPFIPDFSELLLKRFDEVEKQQKNMQIPSAMNKDPELSKPRRKDAPALHATVLLPGARPVNEDKRTIIAESDESDG
ncbi:protein phosphatase 1 regulatory subunit 17 isoform X4 [Engystomops pustulosus]